MKTISKFLSSLLAFVIVFAVVGTASAYSLNLTQKEKEQYHKQYVQIVKDVMKEYPGTTLEVVPLKDFADEDWITPDEFKQLAIERANLTYDESAPINITSSFNTYYNAASDRQFFSSINDVTSTLTSSGSWTQTGYTPNLIDGGRTYAIYVGGKYTLNGLTSSHNIYVHFYCSATGGVSK